jgi:dTDP-4-amino-4,6-dideoxygalactose transaminase
VLSIINSIAFTKAYLDARYKEDFPVTNQLVKEVISLPMHTELDDEQIKFITDSVLEFLNKKVLN